jgi:hypothetical protein
MGRNDAVAGAPKAVANSPARESRWAVVYVAVWLAVAVGFALALGLSDRVPWYKSFFAGIDSAVPAALLGLFVAPATKRFSRATAFVRGLLHAIAASVFSALWAAAIVGELAIVAGMRNADPFIKNGLAWQFVIGVVVYGVLVALATVREGRERERKQQRVIERSETLRLRAELDAVRARLDPHFLFNALQTLGALIDERPSHAHRALEYLSSLLRRRLDNVGADSDLASFELELRDAREYLALAGLSLGERLGVTEDVARETLPLLVPRFCVQPLIENAILHGIAPRKSGGCVSIGGRMISGDKWTFTITDDGVGATSGSATDTGIGLATLRERLRIHFGDNASMRIQTSPGNGYRVTLELPCLNEEGAND